MKVEPSGSRAAITINGAEGDRKALVAGMECATTYDPAAKGNEPWTAMGEAAGPRLRKAGPFFAHGKLI